MPLRIPEREKSARITIGEAFVYLVRQTIKPESKWDIGAAVHFAGVRIFQRATLNAAQAAASLPLLEGFDTDPIDIVSAICDGIVSKKLTIEGMPEQLIKAWAASQWSPGQFITDWGSGQVFVEIGGRSLRFLPTLDRNEIDDLFAIGREEVQSSSMEVTFGSMGGARPVAPAALEEFVRTTMAADRLTQPVIRERADAHFAPKRITEAQWRAVWKDEPNKLRPGEKPPGKSDERFDT